MPDESPEDLQGADGSFPSPRYSPLYALERGGRGPACQPYQQMHWDDRQESLRESRVGPTGVSAGTCTKGLSASWAYVNGCSLEGIKQSLYGRSDGVFQSSFLRNMSAVSAGLD